MKNQIFIQARLGSTRLPQKVLLTVCGKSIIELIVERIRRVKNIDKIVLLTSKQKLNDQLEKEAKRLGIDCFRGSEENVLDRFYQASKEFKPDNIIRITGDSPLIEADLINQGLEIFQQGDYDIVSNVAKRTFPDGLDFEAFKAKALAVAWVDTFERFNKNKQEFNQTFINPTKELLEKKKFKSKTLLLKPSLAHIRLTLDYKEDLDVINKIYQNLYKQNEYFTFNDVLKFLNKNPDLLEINKQYVCLDYGLEIEK